jgi:hypothetical protein
VDGWEENDDPVKEHLTFSPNCGWAVNKAIELALENGTYRNPDPMSVEMLEARRSTFLDKWPHEGKRGWTCKIQKVRRVPREVRLLMLLMLMGLLDDRSWLVLLPYIGK